ncbi:ABC transporter substrate-binding protein [Rhodobacter capsulatus]|uniref:Alpha-glucosides ABC transporter, substrate-binding protein n=1 Tax=Rhodobacter capsulatus (strain ATCC BAA-309 / NBRC 16581 / SB1003) TaxID=272942 RepID=D5AU77_RHOCB|nr:ABC transporter substrate-binding protein [Rhodobacter capsulatus]ADE85516.1 alpha-glucosides ABC transporter, substrate-binding protein [Rhodobacter capsulatus SB 1003]ETD01550.1 alpha-glucoside ABC transporter substrate-binding protein [Rhodobacter capsulatus DE442]ETD76617.1 alpha-glucoside ABC transporter substrate-binding protein [Rhodobacter capsulatus R121]ETE53453.1 alpha-glucoside ABC transporter substrate-binding protein [Rhodobacter capsulatus Y262]MDS0927228.1 ABC transporter su
MTKHLLLGAAVLALATSGALAREMKFAPGEDARFHWDSFDSFKASHDLKGQKLVIDGPWGGVDKALFETVLAAFETATGASVDYNGGDGFEQRIMVNVEAGSPPDVAVVPQPGLAADLARRGKLVPLGAEAQAWLAENYAAGQSWVDLGSYAGPDGTKALYGLFYKIDLKSLVWYSPENFEDAGYEVPQTMEELKALTEKIVADGGTPWCIGLGSGPATGWPATDWVEDMMLRNNTPEDYDAWTTNALPFTDPKVLAAIDDFGWFAKTDAFVAGGAGAVGATDFRDSPKGLFSSPPQCYMHRQASFIPSFFPEGTQIGEDVDFFYFPAYAGKDLGKPVLGAGTVFVMTRESPAAKAFFEFLQTPIAHEIWMAQTGFLTPLKTVNPEVYGDATLKKMGQILLNASTFRFDGSDLMPGAVGAGTFWTGMVDYVGGKDSASVAAEIQKSWDAIK